MSIMNHVKVLIGAWKAESEARRQSTVRHTDTDFLPAALEISESPPSPTGRAILWVILAAAVGALLWSVLGRMEIVAIAEGRVIPLGRLQSIEAAEPGTVREIHVREGAKVKAGDPLVSLDPTFVTADVGAALAEFDQATLAAARGRALLDYVNGKEPKFLPPEGASPEVLLAEQEAVASRISGLQERLAGLGAREAAARSAIVTAQAQVAKIDATIPLAQEQWKARDELDRSGYGARLVTLQAQERVVALEYDRKVQFEEMNRARAELSLLSRERNQAVEEFRAQAATELAEAESAKSSRRETATKARERARLQTLAAPLDGVVVEVAVTTVGERVEAGAPLMTLVPSGQELVIEALVLNKDVGFIKVGDTAAVKLEAYPFTRYGYLKGRVDRIAADAVTDERRGLVFPVRVRVEQQALPVRGAIEASKGTSTRQKSLALSPGMAASVEITTGERRIIDFVLSPISKAVSEAGRER
jgi:hemolysin D